MKEVYPTHVLKKRHLRVAVWSPLLPCFKRRTTQPVRFESAAWVICVFTEKCDPLEGKRNIYSKTCVMAEGHQPVTTN